ncbi:MAG: GFA family protein [Alphaproteobacteria bacterium]|nr:GFA family protein [Alphaproteobacteria bacterium]
MKLEGSCQCGDVRFSVESDYPYPFNLCYCSICRKSAGSGGYAINLSARFETLQIEGADNIRTYSAITTNPETGSAARSQAERSFCGTCGSALWVWDPRWPELLHPLASVIDTELPTPPERTHLMLGSKASWVEPDIRPGDKTFENYPDESIAAWHERLGLKTK